MTIIFFRVKCFFFVFQLQALRRSHAETFVAMCKSHFQSDLDVYLKHSDPIYDALRKVMDQNHKEHEQRLKVRMKIPSCQIIYCCHNYDLNLCPHSCGGGGAVRFALVRVSKLFNFVTNVKKWGHLCPMDTFLVLFYYLFFFF